ncbi:MAG: peptidase M48 family protein [Alphaproteobacteria bacterium]|nr:MAG: peptidase M48 family protein [Alphaproteobacteria bacterium]
MAAGLATYQWNNQIKSVLLLAGFPFLLLLMVWAFFFAGDLWWQSHADLRNIQGAYDLYNSMDRDGNVGGNVAPAAFSPGTKHAVNAGFYGVVQYGPYAFGVALIWFAIAFFFHAELMRMATRSQPITRQQMPRIYNMLENLCISRGLARPQFEVIDSPALNAFATGIDEKSYRIVLTRGIIEKLSDDELESVIGHELTHIINRDARLLIIAVIFVGMISFFAQMLSRTLMHGTRPNYYARRDDRRGGGILISMLIAMAILFIGYIFAIAIRFALSRKREYLADAGSIELTKNPEAMMRALLRISGNDAVNGMPNEVQQMCIENSSAFLGLFATHPPIADRIRVISENTQTPVPRLPVTLRRTPESPWGRGGPPQPPARPAGPWGQGPLHPPS